MKMDQLRISPTAVIAIGTVCLVAVMVAAIVNQPFSWWVFPFSMMFGALFLGVLNLCFSNYQKSKFRRAMMDDHPNEPWMWDARWQDDVMVSRSRSEFWGTLVFAIILGMFAIVGVYSLVEGLVEGNLWVLLNLIPIVAAVYFGRNTYMAWRTLRLERHVSLYAETQPAWVGARFSALMDIETPHQTGQIEVCLEHFKIERREESDGVTFTKVVDRKVPGHVEDVGHGKAGISVDIPPNSPATAWSEDAPSRWWDLVISTRILGTQVLLRYEIPVADPDKH